MKNWLCFKCDVYAFTERKGFNMMKEIDQREREREREREIQRENEKDR